MSKIQAITDPSHTILYPPTDNHDIVDILKSCLKYDPKTRSTIPDLLNHSFLKPASKLSKESIEWVLKKAVGLNLSKSNLIEVLDKIIQQVNLQ